jgi:hypothetical protein
MGDGIAGLVMAVSAAAVGGMMMAMALRKVCPVCEHVFTKGAKCCPYCLNEFD